MPLIRGHHEFDDQFTQIPNDWVRDDRLSLEARGLLAQIMSHRPGWVMSISSIAAQNKISKDRVRRILGELMTHGYLVRSEKQGKDDRGRMTSYDYTTTTPAYGDKTPCTDLPCTENRYTGFVPPKNTKNKEKQIKNVNDQFETFWGLYPRKVGRAAALKAFRKIRDAEAVLDGVRRLLSDPNLPDRQFIPHAATWLNREGWLDEPYPPKPKTAGRVDPVSPYVGGPRDWVKELHETGEHFECRPGEFGCKPG
jgi:hypothetical protein